MAAPRRRVLRVLAACTATALLLGACHHSDADIIKGKLAKATEAAEDADVRGVTDFVAEDFKAGDEFDKPALKGYLAGRLLRGDKITIVRRNESIAVDGASATASFDAALMSGDRKQLKGLVPNRLGTYHFDLTLAKRDGEWLVTKAAWKQIPATELVL